jgi:hypothetical protein
MINIAKCNFSTATNVYSKGDKVPDSDLKGYTDLVDTLPDDFFEKKEAAEKYLREFDPEVEKLKQSVKTEIVEPEAEPEDNKIMTKKDLKIKSK